MKNHIIFKFIAIVLCAASLLGAVGSCVGMFVLAESNLYDRTVEEAYEETLRSYAQGMADHLAQQYASTQLGGAEDGLVNSYYSSSWYYDIFDWSRVGYVIRDGEGNVVSDQSLTGSQKAAHTFEFPASGSYLNVLSVMPREEYEQANAPVLPEGVTTQTGENYVYNAIPETGAEVHFIDILYDDGSTAAIGASEDPLGSIMIHEGTVVFFSQSYNMFPELESGLIAVCITFQTLDNQCIYEAVSPAGVLDAYSWSEGSGTTMTLRNLMEEVAVYDAIPTDGCYVTNVYIAYADGFAESVGGSPDIGYLDYDGEGRVRFVANDHVLTSYVEPVVHIQFHDENGTLVYEARDPSGMGFLQENEHMQMFLSEMDTGEQNVENTVPEETVPAETLPEETIPIATAAEETIPDEVIEGIVKANANVYAATDLSSPVVGFVATGDTVVIAQQVEENGMQWGWIESSGWVLLDQIQLTAEEMPEDAIPMEELLMEEPDSGAAETIPTMVFSIEPIGEESVPNETVMEQETIPEETIPDETMVEQETIPAVTEVPAELRNVEIHNYYDQATGQTMTAEFTYEPLPEYTVLVQMAENAYRYEHDWMLIRLVYSYRKQLPVALAVSLLVFAIFAVYLCCAAGKKPGTTEIRAGGLNCIPLDLYLAAGIGGVALLGIAGVEGTEYLLRSDGNTALLYALLCAFAASLLVVAFCFACAAQFKTPGGYWWRNSLCGWCIRLVAVCWKWFKGFCVRCVPAAKDMGGGAWKILVALFLFGKRFCLAGFEVAKKLLLWLWAQVKKYSLLLGKALARFYDLLPLTWQWLMTGFILVFLLYVALRSYKVGWILLGFGLFFAVILYAASAFGILLENAKRMSKGDLDSKVEDKMLLGGFKDFAGELNSLADVAVVAAQKQLKSERMKTELITNVSHDIKTPLTSIINYVDLLQKPHTPEQQEQYLEVLDRQSQRLKKLIDDLMEMSKASTGNLAVDIGRVDAVEAVNQALGEFADKLDKAQLIAVFRQPEEEVFMLADGRLVWRVMSNLLSNAVKYALPGTRLYVDLQKVDSKVIISMKNISREELNVHADELLERFVRGDASRNTEGSGLGLNIAQSLMELQKGQLQILVDGDLFKVTLIFPGV